MILAKLSGWILIILLCVASFAGCSDQSEQAVAYRKAEAEIDRRSEIVKYKDAAILFESAGEYQDAAQRSKDCWLKYGRFRLRPYEESPLQERLASLQEAKSVFAHIRAAELAATADAGIAAIEAWISVQEAEDSGDDEKAVALLEAMDPKDKKVQETLEFIRTKDERNRRLALLREYLKGLSPVRFAVDDKQSFFANLDKLFREDSFTPKEEMIADALAGMRCYDLIAWGWNKRGYSNGRKLAHNPWLDEPLAWRPHTRTLLLATLQLAEAGDETPEFAEILSLLHDIVTGSTGSTGNDELARYAGLIELYDAGPEWVDKCFALTMDRKDCNTPGTLDYRVLHAPRRFKDTLYDAATDFPANRLTRLYSPQDAKELFENFVPSTPLKTGFIFILDKGTPPPNASRIDFPNSESYQDFPKSVTVSHERIAPSPRKVHERSKGMVVDPPEPPAMIEENISQKGEYFCVANPNNARIAIYETYSYSHYGTYNLSGGQGAVKVYLPAVDIVVVDLVTKKTLIEDTIRTPAKQRYDVPISMKAGEVYIPFIGFEIDRKNYLMRKLRGGPE